MIGFADFLALVNDGRRPYPWQERFADMAAVDRPAELVSVPTGAGKTTVVEALIWALAMQADRPAADRTVGVRVVWAIDRRILVDEVYEQTEQLADRLDEAWRAGAGHDPLFEVARRLQSLKVPPGEDIERVAGRPLEVTRWRGGVAIPAVAHHPLQAEVITSTVAQIGSRLLFRGYGLGTGSLPVGAALAACDTTICLDEAHLAKPFAETVRAISRMREAEATPVAPKVSVVRLTATPAEGDEVSRQIRLSSADEEVLATRLGAVKVGRLVEPEGGSDREQVQALLESIDGYLAQEVRVVACVCNSVLIARSVFDRLRKDREDVDSILLVGPQRPIDREAMFDQPVLAPEFEPESNVATDEPVASSGESAAPTRREVLFSHVSAPRPLVVVATQTIEVGLDIDVDAMVTQSASAAALVQRFGRLNRAGGDGRIGQATVVRHEGFPLYAEDEPLAWQWLNRLPPSPHGDGIDISIRALAEPPDPVRRARAAELSEAVVETLTHTYPRPHAMADPDIDVYLRGIDAEPANDVSICWRADLQEADPSEEADTYREALLQLAPPRPEEQLSLSLAAARNLLYSLQGKSRARGAALNRQVLDGGDLEGSSPNEVGPQTDSGMAEFRGIPFFVRRGPELLRSRMLGGRDAGRPDELIGVGDIRPGDLIVLPAAIGGVDEFGLSVDVRPGSGREDVASDTRNDAVLGVDPIRLTPGALDLALREEHPLAGPRAQRVQRILRRVAAIESRIADARSDAGRRSAMADLLAELSDLPAIAENREAVDLDLLDLRRLGPTPPPDLLEAEEDFLAATGDVDDVGEGPDEQEDKSQGEHGMALFPGEEESGQLAGWALVPIRGSRIGDERIRRLDAQPPLLEDHCLAVAERVRQFAAAAGLEETLVKSLELAGLAHDLGKAYPRMQSFFRGGVALPLEAPVAKSVFGTADRSADRDARRLAGMPSRWRHELASVAVLESASASGDLPERFGDADVELASHAAIAHHGRAHPIPPTPDPTPPARRFAVSVAGIKGTATEDGQGGWGEGASLRRRHALLARYGPWALAYLESLLILADRAVSAEGR